MNTVMFYPSTSLLSRAGGKSMTTMTVMRMMGSEVCSWWLDGNNNVLWLWIKLQQEITEQGEEAFTVGDVQQLTCTDSDLHQDCMKRWRLRKALYICETSCPSHCDVRHLFSAMHYQIKRLTHDHIQYNKSTGQLTATAPVWSHINTTEWMF